MAPDPLHSLLPSLQLKASKRYGHQLALGFAAMALALLALQNLSVSPFITMLASGFGGVVGYLLAGHGLRKLDALDRSAHSGSTKLLNMPPMTSKLVAWTRLGGVIELVFDTGTWVLVRSDVNDAQWRDVQMMLLWRKRVPSRAPL
jgi:hypothetical protein